MRRVLVSLVFVVLLVLATGAQARTYPQRLAATQGSPIFTRRGSPRAASATETKAVRAAAVALPATSDGGVTARAA